MSRSNIRQQVLRSLSLCPLMPVAIALGLGIVTVARVPFGLEMWALVVFLAASAVIATAAGSLRPFLVWVVLAAVSFLAGAHLASRELSWGREFEPSLSRIVVRARIAETLASGHDFRILLLDEGANAAEGKPLPLPGKGRLFLRSNSVTLQAGDAIEFAARIKKPRNRGNPGEYDWETHCRDQGIGWLASAWGPDSIVVLARGSPIRLSAMLFRARELMRLFLQINSGRFFAPESRHEVRAVLKGIVLGDRGELGVNSAGEIDNALGKKFEKSGLAHMLSASGLHVGIVALMTVILARIVVHVIPGALLWLPFRKMAAAASIPAIVSYCLIVGSRVPAQRATIMGMALAVSVLIDRRGSSCNALAAAAVAILLFYPLSLFTPGFQLSFAAVAGILLTAKPLFDRSWGLWVAGRDSLVSPADSGWRVIMRRGEPILRSSISLLSVSFVATVAVTPFLLKTFHAFPIFSLLANLFAGLILPPALGLGLIASIIGAFWPSAGCILLLPADVLIWIIVRIAELFSELPFATVRIGHLGPVEFVFAFCLGLSVLLSIRRPSRRMSCLMAALLCGLVSAAALGWWLRSHPPTLRVTFLNVGFGDSALIQAPGTRGVLVDGGLRSRYFDSGASIVMPFFNWSGVRSLDAMVVTHPQSDHMGGLISVLGQATPQCLMLNTVEIEHNQFNDFLSRARKQNVQVEEVNRGAPPRQLGRATLTFLNRRRSALSRECSSRDVNNASVVFRLDYGKVSFLFTGDLEKDGEQELVDSGVGLQATVLKVAHHGSKNSTTDRFLDAVRPRIAIVSADDPPKRHVPNPAVLNRLRSRGIAIFWTGRDGAVTVSSDGESITRVVCGRGGEATAERLAPSETLSGEVTAKK